MFVPLPYNNKRGVSHYISLHILLPLIIISFRLLRASICYDNGNVYSCLDTNLREKRPFRGNYGGLVDHEIFCWSFYMKIHHAVTISRLWTLPLLNYHLRLALPRGFSLSDFAT